ncbi:MAG: murein biosynthesis integral membrane protein MurJ, partial [Actinomycetota bacterium]
MSRPGDSLTATKSMAVGTLFSRTTGFLRTLIIAAAIGKVVGDGYNVANTVPNIVYELLLGGVLTSVVVPLLVTAARTDGDQGEAYAQRLLTVVVIGLGLASLLALVLAPAIIHAYFGGSQHKIVTPLEIQEHQRSIQVGIVFARFFLPQIFFYGVGALLGAILNVRGSFAPPMWAPILNNIVVIVAGGAFIAVTSVARVDVGLITTSQEYLLAFGTTLGVIAQTVALFPALRSVRFRLRLRFDLRGTGLAKAARLAGWVFVYVAANQLAYLEISRLANSSLQGSYSIYSYAFLLVLLPHSVVAVSVITALLPRMSANAGEGRTTAVAADLASGIKLSAVILIPAAFASIVLGPLIGAVLFAHHTLGLAAGRLVGATLAAYAISLVPFSAFQLQLRAFYALHDTKTPALINIVLALINVAADVILFAVFPAREQVVGLALGYSVSYFVGYAWFTV